MATGWMVWALLLVLAPQTGNTAAEPARQDLLLHLVGNGQRYEAALPAITCDETLVSQELKRDGKVKEEVRVEATLRVARTENAAKPFTESYVFKTRNGKPVPDQDKMKIPYFVSGGFANGLGFSSVERLACFDIAVTDDPASSTLRVDMKRKENVDGLAQCAKIWPQSERIALVDRASGHVTHIEISSPSKEAEDHREVQAASIDYGPTVLGAETFWLPISGEMHDLKNERRMQVSYSGCRRYASSLKILDDVKTVPEP